MDETLRALLADLYADGTATTRPSPTGCAAAATSNPTRPPC
jgi:hypothetical protein